MLNKQEEWDLFVNCTWSDCPELKLLLFLFHTQEFGWLGQSRGGQMTEWMKHVLVHLPSCVLPQCSNSTSGAIYDRHGHVTQGRRWAGPITANTLWGLQTDADLTTWGWLEWKKKQGMLFDHHLDSSCPLCSSGPWSSGRFILSLCLHEGLFMWARWGWGMRQSVKEWVCECMCILYNTAYITSTDNLFSHLYDRARQVWRDHRQQSPGSIWPQKSQSQDSFLTYKSVCLSVCLICLSVCLSVPPVHQSSLPQTKHQSLVSWLCFHVNTSPVQQADRQVDRQLDRQPVSL